MQWWQRLLWIALAGAMGTLARYGVGGLVHRVAGSVFPWGTLAVNAAGCFLFSLVWSLAEQRGIISGHTRTIVLVGFMGAFTTFSTYMFESGQMLRDGQWSWAAGNVVAQNGVGLVALYGGMWLAEWLKR